MRPLSLLRLNPDSRIMFPFSSEEKVLRTLQISNSTSEIAVAWKVRTTAPKAFLVLPRAGMLKPGESAEVEITLLPDSGEGDLRFQVQATRIEDGRDRLERTAWAELPRSEREVAELRAVLVGKTTTPSHGSEGWTSDRVGGNNHGHAREQEWPAGDGDGFRNHAGGAMLGERLRRPGFGASWGGGRGGGETDGGPAPRNQAAATWETRGSTNSASTTPPGSASSRLRERTKGGAPAGAAASTAAGDQRGPIDVDRTPPVSLLTKVVLGVLIGALAVNLYLRPLLALALGSSSSPRPPAD